MLVSLSVRDTQEITNGHKPHKMAKPFLVFHQLDLKTLRISFIQWEARLTRKRKLVKCTVTLTETSSQASRKIGNTTGNLTRPSTDSVMEKRGCLTEQPWPFIVKEWKSHSQRQSSSRRLLRIIKLLLLIFLESPKILDKVRMIEVKILCMV